MTYSFSELDFLKPELGAEFIGEGTHFALFSAHAEAVELCLFSPDGKEETQRLALPKREGDIWSGFVAGLQPGTLYGYRVHGPYDPKNGHRFNPNKLLIDPYAKQIVGDLKWDDSLYGYGIGAEDDDLSFDERDSAAFMPKGVVQNPDFDWNGDEAIRRPWTDTIIYEAHVRGLTMQHPDVPDELRGTFLGMCSEPILDHLTKLGVSAIELLPVQYFLDDRYLVEKNLRNFWGYQTLGFFAPQSRYLSGNQIAEFKTMVKAFHSVGIEVIMDVVYNHTAEGSERGPTLSFRGIDNLSYYIQSPDELRHTFDTTGTGNTLNVAHPMVMRMVLDSLRYWVGVMHVDGFRFDLASTLGREGLRFDREGGFFDAIRQDPMLAGVKLIAEPWDVGDDGYQVGGFPFPFREWNDKFRDDVRGFWRKDQGLVAPLAERLTGSPVQFDHSGRSATTSVNLLSAHDGFVLADVTSFNDKHNEANGEENRDGHDGNQSDNMGIEGDTDDETVLTARARRQRAMIATLFVSQGVPMLLGGDELGNSQNGNNNSYCQDNEIGWIDWSGREAPFLDFCRAAIAFRQSQPLLRQERFLKGEPGDPPAPYVSWLKPDGSGMDESAWGDGEMRIVMMHLKEAPGDDGDGAEELLLVLNAGDATPIHLPEGGAWQFAFSSAEEMEISDAGETESPGQSVLVFSRRQ